MFQQGQKIIYGSNGVCVIESITKRSDALLGERTTYVIRLTSGLVAYVPVDGPVFMRELIAPEEAERVILEYPSVRAMSFPGSNSKALSDRYRAILGRHDPLEMLSLFKTLRSRVEQAKKNGKRPGTMDERFSAMALESVLQELCEVLGADEKQILGRLGLSEDAISFIRPCGAEKRS